MKKWEIALIVLLPTAAAFSAGVGLGFYIKSRPLQTEKEKNEELKLKMENRMMENILDGKNMLE